MISRSIRSCAQLACIAALALPAPGRAEPTPQLRELQDGIEAYTQVEYGPALMYLKAALQRARDRNTLALAYFYLGCTHLALEETAQARAAFETLLSFHPAFAPSRRLTSPKIATFFEEVRWSYATPDGPPLLAHQPPAAASAPVTTLWLEVQNLAPRLRPVLYYRPSSSPRSSFVIEGKRLGSGFRFTVPPPADGSDLLYHFALVDRQGIVVQELRTASDPFRLHAPPKRAVAAATPWYKSWWLWTTVGAVVATSAGLGLGLGLRGEATSEARVTILRRDSAGATVPIFGK